MKVKIIGVSGSPRKGNTNILVQECLAGARELKDVETEFIHLADYRYDGPCTSCFKCIAEPDIDKLCRSYKDDHNEVLKKLLTGDGFIFGSPVYWGGLCAQWKMFWDRTQCCHSQVGKPFRNKVFGSVTVGVAESAGQEHVVAEIIRQGMFHDMFPVPLIAKWPAEGMSSPWGVCGHQGFPKELHTHEEGYLEAIRQDHGAMACCRVLGARVAEMAKVIKAGFTIVNPENGETKWPEGRLTPKFTVDDLEAHLKA